MNIENITDFLNISYNNIIPETGKILISQPLMMDGCFSRSVVLITDYSETGTVGLILNKLLPYVMDDVTEDFPARESQVSFGGPLATHGIQYLHTFKNIPDAVEVVNGIYWGGKTGAVRRLLSLSIMKPEDIRFFIGYSGWISGQLEEELKANSWLVGDIHPSQIIRPTQDLWKTSVRNMGDKYQQWTNLPENPIYN